MRSLIFASAALAGAVLAAAVPSAASAQSFEDEVLAEMNRVRAHPAEFARELQGEARIHRASWGGSDDVAEAIDFLKRQPPLPPLRGDRHLADAAFDHVEAQGPTGDVGHGPSGGLGRRLQSHGVWAGLMAENISYGQMSARDVVRQLVVDEGVPGRGHRKNVFAASYQVAGVACGPHARWGAMCVIDYAGALAPR